MYLIKVRNMDDTICIPRARYKHLVKCEKIVDSEFSEKFSEKFIFEVKESESEYNKGEITRVKDKAKRKKLFNSL